MAKVLLKKSSVSSNVPGTGDLDYGEIAINYADGRLYYKNSSNQIKNFVDSDILLANYLRSLWDDKSPEIGGNLEINSFTITNDTYGPGSYIALQRYYTGDSAQQAVFSSRQDVNIIIDANNGSNVGTFHIRANDSDINTASSIFSVLETGDVTITGNVDLNGKHIYNLAYPNNDSDAANKGYVDAAAGVKVNRSGDTMTGVLNMGTNRVINVSDPASAQDAATKKYVDDTVAAGVGAVEYPSGDYGLVDSAGAIDAFGVFISISAYDHMDPSGSLVVIDHGTDSSI